MVSPVVKVCLLQTCLPDYRLPLVERLVAANPDVRLLCGRDYFTASLALCTEPASWRTFVRNYFLLGRSLLWQSGAWNHAVRADILIAEFNPRILSTWAILLWRAFRGRPTLLWGHLWGQHGPQWMARHVRTFMMNLSDGMICYTRSQESELQKIRPGFPAWAAANSCVTREQCVPTAAPSTGGCITYVGRLVRDKKPALLVEAFAQALPRLPEDAKLLLIGDGKEWTSVKRRVSELGLDRRVEMPGHIADFPRLRAIYGRSLVAVSPGYVGLSAIQAMAFGVPMLVANDEPHSPEIEACLEGETAAFFESEDVDDLANKLVDFYSADSKWPLRREKISRFIADGYTFDGMVETFLVAIQTAGGPFTEHQLTELPEDAWAAVVWAQFGPYHLARLKALRQEFGSGFLGVEIGSQSSTYEWRRKSVTDLKTLMPGATAEQVSAVSIYLVARRLFRTHHIKLVFAPSYWPASSLAVIAAARAAGARVVMMNDSHALTAKAKGVWAVVKRRLVLQFDAALVAGTPQREYFSGMGFNPEKIVTGYDVVDNAYFISKAVDARAQRDKIRRKHGLPARYFLNVGRMVWKKNLEILIDAYVIVKNRLGGACPSLVLVGSGPLESALRERASKAGLTLNTNTDNASADIHFFGFKQVDELPEFYAFADCFVLPSREEEWGLVVNEAMASGLPVVVSRVAGCARDLVQPGRNGFLFDPFDATELAIHLETIALDPERAREMGGESQRIIAGWGCERFATAAREAARIALGDRVV